jgi:hypothetical protein
MKINDAQNNGRVSPKYTMQRNPRRQVLEDAMKASRDHHLPDIEIMAAMVLLYRQHKPLWVKVTEGARAGTIARMDRDMVAYNVWQEPKTWNSSYLDFNRMYDDKLIVEYHMKDFSPYATVHAPAWIAFDQMRNAVLKFDDRKPINIDYATTMSLEFLPEYQGPSVYEFTRVVKSKEELVAEKNPYKFPVIDQLGHQINQDDMFIYGTANYLIIGQLKRVSDSGVITYKPWDGTKESKIMSASVLQAVKEGKSCAALMLFDKKLMDRMMMFKLAK